MSRVEEMDKLLLKCEEEFKELEDVYKRIQEIDADFRKLSDYYDNEYLQDYDVFNEKENTFRVVDQDSVWNVLTAYYQQKVAFSKLLVNFL